jgi:hypothetical protein
MRLSLLLCGHVGKLCRARAVENELAFHTVNPNPDVSASEHTYTPSKMSSMQAPEDASYSADTHHVEKKHPPSTPHDKPLFSDKLAHSLMKVKPFFEQAAATAEKGLEKAGPYTKHVQAEAQKVWTKYLKPYHADELLPGALGALLVLAGGFFPVLIATVEAVRITGGWPGIQSSVKALHSNYIVSLLDVFCDLQNKALDLYSGLRLQHW